MRFNNRKIESCYGVILNHSDSQLSLGAPKSNDTFWIYHFKIKWLSLSDYDIILPNCHGEKFRNFSLQFHSTSKGYLPTMPSYWPNELPLCQYEGILIISLKFNDFETYIIYQISSQNTFKILCSYDVMVFVDCSRMTLKLHSANMKELWCSFSK